MESENFEGYARHRYTHLVGMQANRGLCMSPASAMACWDTVHKLHKPRHEIIKKRTDIAR